jgi:hypothetical protein
MADMKISALPLGGVAQSTDVFPAVRGGSDYQLSIGAVVTLALASVPTQVNADWNANSGLAQILNKPAIPAAQVSADWNASSGVAQILNKPILPSSISNSPHQWLNSYTSSTGVFTQSQPSFADISGTATAAQYVAMVGDGGSGGVQGAVPAPGAGSAAAGKFLRADGTWAVPPGGSGAVSSVFGRTGTVVAAANDYTVAQVTGAAPLASPALTGAPTAPTAAPGTNTTQIATTAFVAAAVGAATSGLSDPGSNGIVKRTSLGITAIAVAADINSTLGYTAANDAAVCHLASSETISGAKAFSASPTAPTPATADNSTSVATTAFVKAQGYITSAGAVASVFGRTGVVVAAANDYTVAQVTGAAPLASPALTGTPTAPTATPGTNTTQLATTAFVTAAVGAIAAGLSDPGGNGIVKRTALNTTAVAVAADINSTLGYTAANDVVVAHLAGTETFSGAKTFSVSPVVPTAAALDNSTKAASTAYADLAVAVEKTRAQAAEALLAPLASAALTGSPTAPTQTTGDVSTKLATTAFVSAAVSAMYSPLAYSVNSTVATSVRYGQATGGAGGITLTLQSTLLAVGQIQRFKKMDSAVGAITFVDSNNAQFEGQPSYLLTNQWQWADFVWDGTQYTVFGN